MDRRAIPLLLTALALAGCGGAPDGQEKRGDPSDRESAEMAVGLPRPWAVREGVALDQRRVPFSDDTLLIVLGRPAIGAADVGFDEVERVIAAMAADSGWTILSGRTLYWRQPDPGSGALAIEALVRRRDVSVRVEGEDARDGRDSTVVPTERSEG